MGVQAGRAHTDEGNPRGELAVSEDPDLSSGNRDAGTQLAPTSLRAPFSTPLLYSCHRLRTLARFFLHSLPITNPTMHHILHLRSPDCTLLAPHALATSSRHLQYVLALMHVGRRRALFIQPQMSSE